MARTGWSTSNFLRYAGGIITAAPVSIAAWFYPTTTTGVRLIAGLFNSSSATANRDQFNISCSGATIIAATGNNAGQASATGAGTFSANTWNHAAGTFASATSRFAYLNGAVGSVSSNSRIPAGIDRTSIGVIDNAAIASAFDSGGRIGEVAYWSVALTDAEVASLADGVHPFLVRPDALVAYFPMIGAYSPEINLKSNAAVLSMQGTLTKDVHPRIFMPPRRGLNAMDVPAAGFTWSPMAEISQPILRPAEMVGY